MCIKRTNVSLVAALMTMPFVYTDCTINDEQPYVTEVYDICSDKCFFVITLLMISNTQMIRIVVNEPNAIESLLSINISGIFETLYVDKFCQLRGINELREFLNNPLNNTRQL